MNKAIFLDRDGTINEDSAGYTHKIEDLKFIPFVIEGLKKLQESGYNLIIVTNQGGIERGVYTMKNYLNFRKEIHEQLACKGITILAEYFCSHHPNKNCNCRKPKTGMLEQAAKDFDLNLKKCWMIGDKESDILAGKNGGCKSIHVLTGYCNHTDYADFTANNLLEAANYILRNNNK